MTGIGIGTSDFKKLRLKQYYYIDKTEYIKHIIDNKSEVILVTRPRRFGKTLNMSMLKYYFDCTDKYNKELFEGLKIMEAEEEYTSKMGYYPCMYLTFKDAGLMTYEMMIMQLKTVMMELYFENRYLLEKAEMSEGEKNIFNKILGANATDIDLAENSISFGPDIKCYIGPKYKEKFMEVLNDEYFTNDLDCDDYAKQNIS